jgi:hypothetical protein
LPQRTTSTRPMLQRNQNQSPNPNPQLRPCLPPFRSVLLLPSILTSRMSLRARLFLLAGNRLRPRRAQSPQHRLPHWLVSCRAGVPRELPFLPRSPYLHRASNIFPKNPRMNLVRPSPFVPYPNRTTNPCRHRLPRGPLAADENTTTKRLALPPAGLLQGASTCTISTRWSR